MIRRGVIRKLDAVGRVSLPADMRRVFHWEPFSLVSITQLEQGLMIEPYHESCAFCGSEDNLQLFRDRWVCRHCLEELSHLLSLA